MHLEAERTPVNAREIVEAGGGLYRGEMASLGGRGPLVLFDDPNFPPDKRSTMALWHADLTAENVRRHIREKAAEYAKSS